MDNDQTKRPSMGQGVQIIGGTGKVTPPPDQDDTAREPDAGEPEGDKN